ncbi:uncharacterized protein LOC111643991 [Copidosoma floridanum]|uniref:uncharacterized protein LOC111643991 n=1 Tax=Copidosoma floridanum TaxID=29053 RepID=UPI000C6F6B00|nr:uncharacterized protein LOC111643991 [Copidosoma floridanum]
MAHGRRAEAFLIQLRETVVDEEKHSISYGQLMRWQGAINEDVKEIFEVNKQLIERVNILEKCETDSSDLRALRAEFTRDIIKATNETHELKESVENGATENLLRIEGIEKNYSDLKKSVDKLHEDIDRLYKDVDDSYYDVQSLRDRMGKFFDEAYNDSRSLKQSLDEKLYQVRQSMRQSTTNSSPSLNLSVPKFKGRDGERPIKFLSELERYVNYVRPRDSDLPCIFAECCEETARDWWYLHEHKAKTLAEFKRKFCERYWSPAVQQSLRRKLEFGQYQLGGKYTRAEYATHMFGFARDLDIPSNDKNLLHQLAAHFGRNFKHAIMCDRNSTDESLLELLAEFDADERRYRGLGPDKNRNASSSNNPAASNANPSSNTGNRVNNNNHNNNRNSTQTWRSNQISLDQEDEGFGQTRDPSPQRGNRETVKSCLVGANPRDCDDFLNPSHPEKNLVVFQRNLNHRSIFFDAREELLYDINPHDQISRGLKCPEIEVALVGVKVMALLDSGSEISCISEAFYETNKQELGRLPTLPLTGKYIKVATGQRSCKIKKQIFIPTAFGDHKVSLTYVVVPKLTREVIIGFDAFKELDIIINSAKMDVTLRIQHREIVMPLISRLEQSNNYESHYCKVEYNNNKQDVIIDDGTFDQTDESYEITPDEVEDKIKALDLSDGQKSSLKELIQRYQPIFEKRPRLINTYVHELVLKDKKPFFTRPYPVPLNYREQVQNEIDKMLKLNVIRRSFSPYINPIRVVIKKDKTVRLCIDARKLNENLVDDYESPPGIEELFPRCRHANFISNLDLTSSYWQIPLSEESKQYTAFKLDNHVYEFNVVAFGIKTSGAALLRALSEVLFGLEAFVLQFVDDLAVFSPTFEEHLRHLDMVFERCLKHNLRVHFCKSNFMRREIDFLGHRLSAEGLKPQPEKIATIKNFPVPKNVTMLQSFLGFVNFYTKFVKNYSLYTLPLNKLLRKKEAFVWGTDQQEAFEKIKDLFDENVILKFPDIQRPYILTTDASDYAIAAVLSQKNDQGEEAIITFALNVSNAENKYLSKFFAIYEGPYKVVGVFGDTYQLYDERQNKTRGKFHLTQLKPYYV